MGTTSRQIKFRVWDKGGKLFLPAQAAGYVMSDGKHYLGFSDDHTDDNVKKLILSSEFGDKDGFVIQQFAGLKDKNDCEIYEGDIVEFVVNRSTFDKVKYERMKLEVKFYPDKGFRAYWGHEDCNSEKLDSKVKIIGNIFENPELLKS